MALSDLLGPSLQVGSTLLSAGGSIARGQAAKTIAARRKKALDFEAEQLETEADMSRGVGLRQAQDEQMKTSLVNSSALARAAASGAGASDPTVINVLARTAGEGAYRQALALYEGEAQARIDRMRASGMRFQGDVGVEDAAAANRSAQIGAASTVLSGGVKAMSMYDKYWSGPRGYESDG